MIASLLNRKIAILGSQPGPRATTAQANGHRLVLSLQRHHRPRTERSSSCDGRFDL